MVDPVGAVKRLRNACPPHIFIAPCKHNECMQAKETVFGSEQLSRDAKFRHTEISEPAFLGRKKCLADFAPLILFFQGNKVSSAAV